MTNYLVKEGVNVTIQTAYPFPTANNTTVNNTQASCTKRQVLGKCGWQGIAIIVGVSVGSALLMGLGILVVLFVYSKSRMRGWLLQNKRLRITDSEERVAGSTQGRRRVEEAAEYVTYDGTPNATSSLDAVVAINPHNKKNNEEEGPAKSPRTWINGTNHAPTQEGSNPNASSYIASPYTIISNQHLNAVNQEMFARPLYVDRTREYAQAGSNDFEPEIVPPEFINNGEALVLLAPNNGPTINSPHMNMLGNECLTITLPSKAPVALTV
eukprot:CAMPEP_0175042590 /NCGR_PEP_ID=MMETSP0052_2-20121109/2665_1 /TAXON_ID=51329 ORGANISM="Polytomella parva, Strain SAG 63-3" /NCGR_SAMPLE_ID=MMETSP0052_2 /ASSEMBLY_ACC=CAM_ASM_000194 /LENGTH=268 /DNA_ID=CAMNT_0016305453 /DNA_START=814 /DNA_END=1620 /DNA_ORIENTATION=-